MNVSKEIVLGSLIKGIRGVSYKPDQLRINFNEKTFYLLRSNNIQAGKVIYKDVQIVDEICVSERQRLTKGDIIVCMSNGSRALVGKSALFNNINDRYCVGAFCSTFRVKNDYNPEFVFQILLSQAFKLKIDVILSGSAINNLQNKHIEELKFYVPESKVQQTAIARILSTADRAIEQTEALIAKYQRIKTGLMQDLLTKGIDAQGNIRSKTTHRFVVKEGVEVPEEWEVVELGAVCSKISDGAHLGVKFGGSRDVPFLFVSCLKPEKILWENCAWISNENYLIVSRGKEPVKGMVLYSVVGSYGNAAVVNTDIRFTFQRHIAFMITKINILIPEFLSLFLNSEIGKSIADEMAIGNAQKTITLTALRKFPIYLPDLKEQKGIFSRINGINNVISETQIILDKLNSQKKGLMQDLLSGKVSVI